MARESHRVCAEQITKKLIRVNKAVRSRRTWSKFGDCDGQEVGANLPVHAEGDAQKTLVARSKRRAGARGGGGRL